MSTRRGRLGAILGNDFNSHLATDGSVGLENEYPYGPQPPAIDTNADDVVLKFFSRRVQQFRIAGVISGLALCTFFAGVNLAVCPLMDLYSGPPAWHLLPMFALVGAILTEGGLLSAWLVFLGGPFWLRAAICWTVGSLLWSCWAMGLFFVSSYGGWGFVGEILQLGTLSLPLAALAIQLPLWFARTYLGWRLKTQDPRTLVSQPFSIRDYFVGTAVVAISITFARLARPANWPLENYWPGWAIAFCFLACGSLIGILPAIFFTFRVRNAWLGFALVVLYGFAVACAVAYVPNVIDPGFTALETAAVVTLITSLAAFLGLGFGVARGCGYRLETGRAPRSQS